MRICASLSKDYDEEEVSQADLVEIRSDIFDKMPEIDKELIITIKGNSADIIPAGFKGMVDAPADVDIYEAERISSYHDHNGTPNAETIVEIMNSMDGDIAKGAFQVNDISDLLSIYDASPKVTKRHVILGMGELGTITRIRQKILKNEFTFAHAGTPIASGQLPVSEMRRLGDDCIIIGLLGHPLKPASQRMHDAAFEDSGINGKYLQFDTSSAGSAGDVIRSYNIRGVNVTIPFKSSIMEQLDSLDKVVKEVGAVNTIVNDNGHLKGYNTDVHGIECAFKAAGVNVRGKRSLIIGSGGSARACAYFLREGGSPTSITGRNLRTAGEVSKDFGCRLVPQDSVALKMYDIIINCTPLQNHEPIPLEHLDRSHIVFDLVHHAETVLVRKAAALECTLVSGKDMLVAQGAESFRLWTGVSPDQKIMRDAL